MTSPTRSSKMTAEFTDPIGTNALPTMPLNELIVIATACLAS